jgi:hypothetical protein
MIIAEEAIPMKSVKYYIPCTEEEVRIVLHSLVQMRNRLIREGRFTDCVDELIAKLTAE